ncbi:MAG TPA: histidine kinase dimerization/phospho-acceptor domain-containing protein, partial [Anaerolineales bacterium]
MKNRGTYREPLSTLLRRHPQGSKTEIANTVRWIGYSSLGIFLVLIFSYVLEDNYLNTVVVSIGAIPIVISLMLIRQDAISFPSAIMAVTIIFLIPWLATFSQGIYDIGVLGYPVILIVAGLILRGGAIMYLAFLIIACMAWLAFGDLWNLYQPVFPAQTNLEDFFIGSIIILVTRNAVYRLVRNVFQSLSRAEQEIRMREEAEKEREEIIHHLDRKNQELDRFAIRVSHDLKTPLITLAGFLGYLEKDINDGDFERARKDFSQINDAAKTMGKFVDELLDLSRVGRITNPPREVAFDEIIQDALKAVDGVLKSRQVQVEIDAIFPFVHVDRARTVQVM